MWSTIVGYEVRTRTCHKLQNGVSLCRWARLLSEMRSPCWCRWTTQPVRANVSRVLASQHSPSLSLLPLSPPSLPSSISPPSLLPSLPSFLSRRPSLCIISLFLFRLHRDLSENVDSRFTFGSRVHGPMRHVMNDAHSGRIRWKIRAHVVDRFITREI